jgi:hypothetical protein
MSSIVAIAKLLYFASVDNIETVTCFFDDQDIKLDPRKMSNLVVDFLSSRHPAQSASVRAMLQFQAFVNGSFKISENPFDC